MNYWIVKSDPETYGWQELIAEKKTDWTGIRSYAARNNLKAMKKDDLILFYHSGGNKDIVGIAKVTKEYFPDTTSEEDAWVAVELAPVKPFKKSVTLAEIKATKEVKNIQLVKIGRLSVSPVTKPEFEKILSMGETKL